MRRTFLFSFLLIASSFMSQSRAAEISPRRLRVAVPAADLRREPVRAGPTLEQDPLEESQLLYGDPVEVQEEKAGWVRVNALEQLEWTHHKRWEGYPGWMESTTLSPEPEGWIPNLVVTGKEGVVLEKPEPTAPVRFTLSLGTRLVGVRHHGDFEKVGSVSDTGFLKLRLLDGSTGWIQADQVTPLEKLAQMRADPERWRARLVQTARLFLGDPYYWGGRSAHNPSAAESPHTAVDCSGLVGLVYQANGMIIPRDAHEQWMQAWPIEPEQLLPGDLIFLHDLDHPEKIVHVMLYAPLEEERLIEGPGTGKPVRELPLAERLKETKGRRISFGTYLPQ